MVDPYVLELNKWLLQESAKWSQVIKKFSPEDFTRMHEEFISECGGTNDVDEIAYNKKQKPDTVAKKIPSYEKTLPLVEEGKTLEEIAKARGVTVGTIISHLEKLKEHHPKVSLKQYKPTSAEFKAIKTAFKTSKEQTLSAIHKKLKGEYTYEQIRLARLCI